MDMEEDRTPAEDDAGADEGVGLRKRDGPRFWPAMAAYAGLALLAGLTLNGPTMFEYRLRVLVWLMLAALAVKTWIHKTGSNSP